MSVVKCLIKIDHDLPQTRALCCRRWSSCHNYCAAFIVFYFRFVLKYPFWRTHIPVANYLFTIFVFETYRDRTLGSGCGSVVRTVTSDARGPRFESSYRQTFIWNICRLYVKTYISKEKEAGNGPILNISWPRPFCLDNTFNTHTLFHFSLVLSVLKLLCR